MAEEEPASLDEARRRKTAGGGGGGKKDALKVRKHKLTAKEIKAIEKKYGIKSDGLPLDRAGHAERVFTMAEASKSQILLGTDNRWRIYDPDTGRWSDDEITRFRFNEYVIQVGNLMYHNASILQMKLDAGDVPDDQKASVLELIKIYETHAVSLRNVQDPVRNVAAAKATEERRHLVEPIEFDSDKDRILCRNYVIDLPTGKKLPHGPQHKFTRWIDLDYDSRAKAPTFNLFLDYVIPDADVREWLQRWAGYCLTGHIDEQLIGILLGDTGTGKSTLIKLIARTMGTVGKHGYARKVPEGLFRKASSHWGDTARLINTRFAYDSEFEQDTVLNAERMRQLTGEDEIDGNEKMKAFKYFELLAKFMISTNTMPPMSAQDPLAVREATLRRLMIVPMNETMEKQWSKEELPQFFQDLYGEKAGILAWLVAGAKAWYEHPLTVNVPAAMQAAQAEYGETSGITSPILKALLAAGYKIDPADLTLKTSAKDLNAAMPASITATALGLWLADHGCASKKSGVMYWIGVGK